MNQMESLGSRIYKVLTLIDEFRKLDGDTQKLVTDKTTKMIEKKEGLDE